MAGRILCLLDGHPVSRGNARSPVFPEHDLEIVYVGRIECRLTVHKIESVLPPELFAVSKVGQHLMLVLPVPSPGSECDCIIQSNVSDVMDRQALFSGQIIY